MSTTLDDIYRQMDEIRVRREELWTEMNGLWEQIWQLGYSNPAIDALKIHVNKLSDEREVLWDELMFLRGERDAAIDYSYRGFSRPTGWVMELLQRPMGQLPARALVIEPTKEAYKTVGSYWLQAALTVLLAIGSLITLVTFVPGMAVSPYSLTYDATLWLTRSDMAAQIVPFLVFLLIINKVSINIHRSPKQGRFFAKAAMTEELWFRMGAESWTWRQRVYGCFAFGLVHVVNFIYPVASLLVVGFVSGGAMTIIYLREYKRSGNTERATLASAKFHTQYNYIAIAYMAVAMLIVLGVFPLLFNFIS